MSKVTVSDERYKFSRFVANPGEMKFVTRNKRKYRSWEIDALVARAMAGKIPVEVVRLKPGELASLPVSVYGKTTVSYVGNVPYAALEHDQYGNIQMCIPSDCALEVVFNSEKVGAVGRNRGAHGKKIIYLVN